jgi:hypothetical protein
MALNDIPIQIIRNILMNSFSLYEKEKLKKLYVVSFGKAAS